MEQRVLTVYSNRLYAVSERRRMYEAWAAGLAARNPALQVYGADFNNTSVNHLSGGNYWRAYQQSGGDELLPRCHCAREIRF